MELVIAIIIVVPVILIGSLIYSFYYKKPNFIIGLILGILSVAVAVLNPTSWFYSYFIIPIIVSLVYLKDGETGKGMLIGAIAGFLASIIFYFSKFAQ